MPTLQFDETKSFRNSSRQTSENHGTNIPSQLFPLKLELNQVHTAKVGQFSKSQMCEIYIYDNIQFVS